MTRTERIHLLLRTDPFELLPRSELEALADRAEVRAYPASSYVFRQGDPSGDALHIVGRGLVEFVVANDRREESVVALKRPCDFFGETVVFSHQRYPGSARAKEHLTCLRIPRGDLEQLLFKYADFAGFFATLLAERIRLLYMELGSQVSDGCITGVDSTLFRKRVSEVMAYPVITCEVGDSVTAVSRVMAERDINAVVALDKSRAPRGLLTEKNLVRFLIASEACDPATCKVEQIMHSPLLEIRPEAFIGQALVAMMRSKTKHLIVVERGELVGIVSMVDLVRAQSAGTLLLTRDIESQPDLRGLSLVGAEIRNILNAMASEGADVSEIFDVMSELHERLTRRVVQLAEERMKAEGWGAPPVEYCWINTGSAARYEQTFATDQDNALVYATPAADQAAMAAAYFARFSALVVEGLAACGFPPCRDGMTAAAPEWRRSLAEWIDRIEDFVRTRDPDLARMVLVMLDFRPVWGNMALAKTLRKRLFDGFVDCLMADHPVDADDLDYRLPIRFLGTFRTESGGVHKNEMNLKRAGIAPIVAGVRLLAGRHQIEEPATLGRLSALAEAGALPGEEVETVRASFETLLGFSIQENLKKILAGKAPDHYIDPYSLRRRERVRLKSALSGVAVLLDRVNDGFDGFWLRQIPR
jgi:CBS domain-containing protein